MWSNSVVFAVVLLFEHLIRRWSEGLRFEMSSYFQIQTLGMRLKSSSIRMWWILLKRATRTKRGPAASIPRTQRDVLYSSPSSKSQWAEPRQTEPTLISLCFLFIADDLRSFNERPIFRRVMMKTHVRTFKCQAYFASTCENQNYYEVEENTENRKYHDV